MKLLIGISIQELKLIKKLLKKYIPDAEVWAFGSRVKSNFQSPSDLDLVAFLEEGQKSYFYDLQEAFEESDLPFRVDLHSWKDLPENFQKNILENYIILQKKKV